MREVELSSVPDVPRRVTATESNNREVRERYIRQCSEVHGQSPHRESPYGDTAREQRMAMESSHGKTASG